MTGKPPPRNLPPDSERWGRWVEDEVRGLSQSDVETTQGVTNALNGLTATLGQLSGQISTLTSQQATLAAQQVQLTAVVNALPVSIVQTASVNGFAVPNGTSNRVSTTFTVPAGKTRCSIMATYQGFYMSDFSVPDSDRAGFRVVTNTGYVGSPGVMSPDNMDTFWLTGNGGVQIPSVSSAITVSVQSSAGPTLAPAYSGNRIDLHVLAIFS